MRAVADATAEARTLPQSDALTVQEFCDLTGLKRFTATQRLRQLVACGKAVLTTKDIRRGDGAVLRNITAYRLVKAHER